MAPDLPWDQVMRALAGLALMAVAACSSLPPRALAPAVLGAEATPVPRASGQPFALSTATWQPSGLGAVTGSAHTPDEVARAIAGAIDAWDVPALTSRIDPSGWTVANADGELTWRLLPSEAIAWMRERTPDGRVRATLELPPVTGRRDRDPVGDAYVRATFTAFAGYDRTTVRVILRRDAAGVWYWSGIIVAD